VPRYKLTIAYDGTEFCGWQKQEPPDPADPTKRISLRTAQGVVEETVRDVLREKVIVMGASRTDSGVHALGQVAAFTSEPDADKGVGWPEERGTDALVRALNSKLPRDVLVTGAEIVAHDFNPIGGKRNTPTRSSAGRCAPCGIGGMCFTPGTSSILRACKKRRRHWSASTTSRRLLRLITEEQRRCGRSLDVKLKKSILP